MWLSQSPLKINNNKKKLNVVYLLETGNALALVASHNTTAARHGIIRLGANCLMVQFSKRQVNMLNLFLGANVSLYYFIFVL